MDEFQEILCNNDGQKNVATKEYTLYDSVYMKSKTGKTRLWWQKSEQ